MIESSIFEHDIPNLDDQPNKSILITLDISVSARSGETLQWSLVHALWVMERPSFQPPHSSMPDPRTLQQERRARKLVHSIRTFLSAFFPRRRVSTPSTFPHAGTVSYDSIGRPTPIPTPTPTSHPTTRDDLISHTLTPNANKSNVASELLSSPAHTSYGRNTWVCASRTIRPPTFT